MRFAAASALDSLAEGRFEIEGVIESRRGKGEGGGGGTTSVYRVGFEDGPGVQDICERGRAVDRCNGTSRVDRAELYV